MELLRSIPGVGFILAVVIALEVGDVSRFGGPEMLLPRMSGGGLRGMLQGSLRGLSRGYEGKR